MMSESSIEIKFEQLNPLLKEYEILIKTLSEQLEFYKEEQNLLKSEVVSLLQENKVLASNVKELLNGAQNTANQINQHKEDDFVENLKSQISLILTEKESAVELWKNSLTTIDQLEEELKLFQGRNHGYVSKSEFKKMKQEYEKQLKDLEMELIKSKTSLLNVRKSSKGVLEAKDFELKRTTTIYQTTLQEVEQLREQVRKLQKQQEEVIQMRNQLAALLEDKNKIINNLRVTDSEAKAKVAEAVEVVEVALMEKDSALLRESLAKEELSKISKALTDAVDGTNEKLRIELEGTKKQCNEKLFKIKGEMKIIVDQLKIKDAELERHRSTSKMLEEELGRIRRGALLGDGSELSKFLNVERSLEATYQKLLNSEKRNFQLETENARMKEDIGKMNCDYKANAFKMEAEKIELLNKISSLQHELNVSNNNLKQVAGKVEDVNSKIGQIETELKKQLDLKDLQAQEILSDRIKEIEEQNSKANEELKAQLELQISFNHKWKVEVREITQSLEDRIYQLRSEASNLKKTNGELADKLLEAEKQVELYQDYLHRFCLDVSNVAALTK